jgi:exodeoxyribonuclease VII large subunit
MTVVGELSNFKIAKDRWVYADLKDESAKMRLFGTIYQLPGPLEDGMMIEVVGEPRMHPQFGFSFQIRSLRPVGEGTIKKAADLLRKKLEAEGLFAQERKRLVPYPPSSIALVTSKKSAAYADFMKILTVRWPYIDTTVYDTAVQGQDAVKEIVDAIELINRTASPPDVIVLIRGGGSKDDLSAFSSEQVTRAVAASRVSTVVAIGHEIDESLAELAADMRASTPSNAAELLVPNVLEVKASLQDQSLFLTRVVTEEIKARKTELTTIQKVLAESIKAYLLAERTYIDRQQMKLESYHPRQVLHRGYALVRKNGKLLARDTLKLGDEIQIELETQIVETTVNAINKKE